MPSPYGLARWGAELAAARPHRTLLPWLPHSLQRWLLRPDSTELLGSQLSRRRTEAYRMIVAVGFGVFGLLLAAALRHQGREWVGGLTLSTGWFYTLVAGAPPRPSTGWCPQLWRPQVICILIVFFYGIIAQPTPTPPEFSLKPLFLTFIDFSSQIVLAKRDFALLDRVLIGLIIAGIHVMTPLFDIGWREQVLSIGGSLLGFLFGLVVEADQHELQAILRDAETGRQASSRLYHVIKGQCDSAAALIHTVHMQEEARRRSGLPESTASVISDVEGMLRDAAEWCHAREVFQQLDSETYVMQMCVVHLDSVLLSLMGSFGVVDAPKFAVTDPALVRLLVREGLANAIAHSKQGTRIKLRAELLNDVRSSAASHRLHFTITNLNRPEVPHLSHYECEQVFSRKGYAESCATPTRR